MGKLWIAALGVAALTGAAMAASSSCATLNDLPPNTCGNLIVEQTNGEDCDTFPLGADGGVTAMGEGFTCQGCRVVCSTSGASACPDGWGCGVDNLCRRPNGTFTPAAIEIPEVVDHLLVGDLDGDGRQDVVVDTGSQLVIHYFTDGAQLQETLAISAEQPTPALGDFNGDGTLDIAYSLSSAGAVSVRLGSSDRSLAAVPFPLALSTGMFDLSLQTNERLLALREVPLDAKIYKLRELLRVRDSAIVTFTGAMPPTAFITIANVGNTDLPTQFLHPTVPVEIPSGRLIKASPCSQIVVPNKSTNHIEVHQPCVNDALGVPMWNDVMKKGYVSPSIVKMPLGATIDGPAYIADVDGDGNADVAVYAMRGMAPQGAEIEVAYGDGLGNFGSMPGTTDGLASTYFCLGTVKLDSLNQEITQCQTDPPFAMADLNYDGVLDLVNGCGVFLGGGANAKCGAYGSLTTAISSRMGLTTAPWTTAQLVDLNLDGNLDVVAATCGDTVVSYLESDGSGVFNPYAIPATGGVDQLAVGDFDGDLVPDIAFSQRGAPLGLDASVPLFCAQPDAPDVPAYQSLSIAFGAYSGGPSAPVDLAPLSSIQQLVPSLLTSPAGGFQLIDNLIAVTTDNEDKNPTSSVMTLFAGTTTREIVAPYFLIDPMNGNGNVPWLLTMGNYGGGSAAGLAVLASERGAVADMFAHTAEAFLLTSNTYNLSQAGYASVSILGDPTSYAGDDTKGSWMSSANLGGGTGAAVLSLAFGLGPPLPDGQSAFLALTAATLGHPSPQFLPGLVRGPMVVSDVDGDTNDDVIAYTKSSSSAATSVIVLWGGGGPDAPLPVSTIDKQLQSACTGDPGDVLGAVALRTTPAKQREVLIVSEQHLFLASVDPESPIPHTFTVTCFDDALPLPAPRTSTSTSKLLFGAGDVDGDGIDDLVVGNPGSVVIYRGVPVIQ